VVVVSFMFFSFALLRLNGHDLLNFLRHLEYRRKPLFRNQAYPYLA
jgi:hypothetical protein